MNCLKYDRSKDIIMPQLSPTSMKVTYDYSLSQFDPSKSSPPNDFMKKLQNRIKSYNSFINLDNLDKE